MHCQCILSIFPASVQQFYANMLVFVNINPFLYINNQFALPITAMVCWQCLPPKLKGKHCWKPQYRNGVVLRSLGALTHCELVDSIQKSDLFFSPFNTFVIRTCQGMGSLASFAPSILPPMGFFTQGGIFAHFTKGQIISEWIFDL